MQIDRPPGKKPHLLCASRHKSAVEVLRQQLRKLLSGPRCSVSCNFEGRTRHSAIPHDSDALISLYVGTGRQRSRLMPNGEVEGPADHVSWRAGPAISTGSRGAPVRPIRRRGRTISSRARGARPQTRHGPLQRLLEFAPIEATVRARIPQRKPCIRPNEIAALSIATAAANAAAAEPSTDHPKQCPRARGMSSNEVSLP